MSNKILIVFAFLLLLLIGGMYIVSPQQIANMLSQIGKKPIISNTIPQTSPTASIPQDNPAVAKARSYGYNVIWIGANDTVGRTIMYDKSRIFGRGGIGVQTYTSDSGNAFVGEIIGVFDKLENIPNAPDTYLYLKDPRTGTALPKLRVVFDPSNPRIEPTVLIFEYFVKDPQASSAAELVGSLHSLGYEKFASYLQVGDAIVAALKLTKEKQNVYDNENFFIVSEIFIRRF